MDLLNTVADLKTRLEEWQNANSHNPDTLCNDPGAFGCFVSSGFPDKKLERWKNTDLSSYLSRSYTLASDLEKKDVDVSKVLQCEVSDFNTIVISLFNGWYIPQDQKLTVLEDGVVYGSMRQALMEYPDLVKLHLGKYADIREHGLIALNTAQAMDGVFIYVPDGVQAAKTLQMVNVLNHDHDLFVQNRHLIILGKNSHLSLVHCDDSLNHSATFTNSVTEVVLDQDASLDFYKLQNLNDSSALVNTMYFSLVPGSHLQSFSITLNGGLIRNESHVGLNGENCKADMYGLYLMDKHQHVDNQVYLKHRSPHTQSNELFKGILDDHATGVFNGHIVVERDAQKTNAYQTNRNLLLTDKASINTKPFLEIYADDVKCSHGATVGQIDENAMFYLRTRGIGEYNARLLMMYAFAAEVIRKINLTPLRDTVDDLVKKRLRGELAVCDQCVLVCRNQEKIYSFEIDMSKI